MKIKRFLSLCPVIAVFTGFMVFTPLPVSAQSGSSVWEISKNGNTLYLGGSVHILREEDFPLPGEFDFAFENSSILVLETDLEKMNDPQILQYLVSQMLIPGGGGLQSILNSETFLLLKEKCEEFNIPIESVSMLKPSMVVTLLTVLELQKFGFVQQGVDIHYLEKAKEENKSFDFLESVETQINILVSMGEGYEDDYVRYSLMDLESTSGNVITIVSEWRGGESAYTELSIMEMKESWPVLYKALMTDRNNAWMQKFDEFIATSEVEFVIAGLAHMYGPDGLLNLLENSGYTVKQLTDFSGP